MFHGTMRDLAKKREELCTLDRIENRYHRIVNAAP